MTHTAEMLATNPSHSGLDQGALAVCIEACLDCAQACVSCADACLSEDMVADLRRCISLNLDCADICSTTGRVLSRNGESDAGLRRSLLEMCRDACERCAKECEGHAGMHEHCRVCADACRRCASACSDLLALA